MPGKIQSALLVLWHWHNEIYSVICQVKNAHRFTISCAVSSTFSKFLASWYLVRVSQGGISTSFLFYREFALAKQTFGDVGIVKLFTVVHKIFAP